MILTGVAWEVAHSWFDSGRKNQSRPVESIVFQSLPFTQSCFPCVFLGSNRTKFLLSLAAVMLQGLYLITFECSSIYKGLLPKMWVQKPSHPIAHFSDCSPYHTILVSASEGILFLPSFESLTFSVAEAEHGPNIQEPEEVLGGCRCLPAPAWQWGRCW